MLGAVGRVLPATEGPVVLKAQTASGELIGQVRVSKSEEIATVSLVPPDAGAPPAVLRAIAEADQIVLGPGSLFTSVLAACVVPGIREGLRAAREPSASTSRTCASSCPRRPASTSPGSSRRCEPTVSLSTSCSRTGPPLPLGELPDDVALVLADVARAGIPRARPEAARGRARVCW